MDRTKPQSQSGKVGKAQKAGPKAAQKSADDWLHAGLTLLAKQGVEAVKVERLAALLGVTKGSFYWHFRDRDALLVALLTRWRDVSTQAIIDGVNASGGSPAERLHALISATTRGKRGWQLEHAIRTWGARDRNARSMLEAIDAQREAYVRDLLVEHGLSIASATQRAHLFYLTLIGEHTWITHGGAASETSAWLDLLQLLMQH
jgi:AcrR family transcriptional regulator